MPSVATGLPRSVGGLDSRAVAVMSEEGIDIGGHRVKLLGAVRPDSRPGRGDAGRDADGEEELAPSEAEGTRQGTMMEQWSEITQWRKQKRAELLARREAFDAGQRRVWNDAITALLEHGFPVLQSGVIGFCWPYKAEFDARFAMRYFRERGATAALPAVVEKKGPLQFRAWWPGAPMAPGVYGIPVPDGTGIVKPDAAIVPMVGFDNQGYRLGYGGGYFDRTLTSLNPRPIAIGVSFEALRLATIFPQPHDMPMDFVVTEAGIHYACQGKLVVISPADCAAVVGERWRARAAGEPVDSRAYSSPPCYAHEFSGYFGEEPAMSKSELLAFLNALLEAERAGAKVLGAFLDEYEPGIPAWQQLRAVQRDEAQNCAVLVELIKEAGGEPSKATGDFLGKALAIQGKAERLSFLNKGQGWVARKIKEALPKIWDQHLFGALKEMHDSHVRNIEACDALQKEAAR